ncbi:MAG: endolytic transglycosylase MltG [Candidatus Saccharibacteria bacterium]|nr:endolytic transglycosylase MltG [Candidatus Saccharibacteria bacterium]
MKKEKLMQNQQPLSCKISSKKSRARKWWIIGGISLVVLALGGATAVLKYRDYVRAEREKEYARLEAEMQAEVFTFTIVPGETIFDIQKNLVKLGYSEAEVLEAFNADYDFDFLAERDNWENRSLEGYLYGETHEFYKGATVKEILTKYLEGMGKVISDNDLIEKYADLGLTLHEGVTLASIVQKESPGPEMATVAQVFLLRLKYGWRLGSDVTVSYALDVVDPNRETYQNNAAALKLDSCYNTRLHTGLPCGPISSPGLSALLAVAEPTDTAYLYFLTGDDGLMYYSYTEAEHNQNIRSHCKVLCNVSL